jgi:hypothetical protein
MKEEELQAKGILIDVPESKFFTLHDGRVIKNLSELKVAMEQMSEEMFRQHVRKGNNDFANWIRDVIGDRELAAVLARVPNKVASATSIAEKISSLTSKPVSDWSPLFKPPVWPF